MFKWFRNIAARLTSEPRYVGASRVPTSQRTAAGVSITPDSAVTIATVWACLRYLSQTVAVLPWRVMRDGSTGAEIQDKHPIDWMIGRRPNTEWSSFQFRETLTHWALRWGNGYAEIERDQLGRPFALWPIHPERVRVCRDPETQNLYYHVSNSNTFGGSSDGIEIAATDMFHLRGFGEGPVGVNVIHYAAQSLGWARAAQLFGSTFFGNGANVSLAVINKTPISPEGLVLQRAEFDLKAKGQRNWHNTVHLGGDGDVKRIGLNAEETQLIAVHQHLVEEICRWFGVPPHKVMHLLRATFSNIEHQAIEVVVDSVTPWVKRFQDEADWKLFGQNRSGLYTKMNMRALMQGDHAARVAFYDGMVKIGAYSPNRVLELEDENTIGPDGDIHTMQSQNVTLETIRKGEQKPQQQTAPPAPANDDTNSEDAAAVAARDLFELKMGLPVHVEA